jgi:hypothetical protein
MKTIDNISSLEGRRLLIEIHHELKYEKQLSTFSIILLCWRICTHEKEIFKYVKNEVTVIHKLGFFKGTALWMEEIVNRFYFSTINSFVYFGAAILLVLIGIRRFTDQVTDTVVISGIAFEALMLLFLFVVMFFTPQETDYEADKNVEEASTNDLIIEIGELSRDFASAVVKLEKVEELYGRLIEKQEDLINSVNKMTDSTIMAVSPNSEMLGIMKETNISLTDFKNNIESLNKSVEEIKKEQIEIAVRKELEKYLSNKVNS